MPIQWEERVKNPAYTHGHTSGKFSPTYHSWSGMIQRCTNPARAAWGRYGGRGITVCARWRTSFANFLADMGERPAGMTLDRVDNDKGYSPDNCRWATPSEQMTNRRKRTDAYAQDVLMLVMSQDRTLPELYALLGLHDEVVKKVVRRLRKDELIETKWIPGVRNGRTLVCQFSGKEG